jgi:hypothetical protein
MATGEYLADPAKDPLEVAAESRGTDDDAEGAGAGTGGPDGGG